MSRTIALTGATGFIGSAVARRLCTEGWQVRALVRPSSDTARLCGADVDWVAGRLEDVESLRRLMRGAHAVVHCAGAVRGACRAHFNRVNADGVSRLVHAATHGQAVPRFLLISSLAAREPHLSPYAASKRLGERALVEGAGEMSWAALRPAAVYGPGDRELLPLFRWMSRGIAPVLRVAHARFSLLYVEDLVEAVLHWLNREDTEKSTFELHDGHRGGYTWGDVVETIARLRGRPVVRLQVPVSLVRPLAALNLMGARLAGYLPMLTPGKVRELTHPDWVCDNTPFCRETGWAPKVSLERGLRYTLERGGAPPG